MIAALNSCNLGYDIGVNSGVGYHLQAAGEGMELSDLQLEWFYGVFSFSSAAGALVAYTTSDFLGRRLAFAVTSVVFIVGALWTAGAAPRGDPTPFEMPRNASSTFRRRSRPAGRAGAANYASLMCGRVVAGAGVGVGLAIDPVYVSPRGYF